MGLLPWLAKISFAAFAAALLVALAAGFGSRLGFWNVYLGLFGIYPWGVGLALIGFALGIAWAVSAVIANRAAAARYGLIGLLGSMALLASPVRHVYGALTYPRIHDI